MLLLIIEVEKTEKSKQSNWGSIQSHTVSFFIVLSAEFNHHKLSVRCTLLFVSHVKLYSTSTLTAVFRSFAPELGTINLR